MAYRRIHSKGTYRYEEYQCHEAITPGMLCKLNDDNGYAMKHDEEGGRGEAFFAMEDALQGAAVGDAYASGEQGCFIFPNKGSSVNALLADGEAVDYGDELVSDGNGYLKERGTGSSGNTEWQTIAVAEETKDNSSGGAAVLIKVRIV